MLQIIKLLLKKFGPYLVIAMMLIAQCVTGWQLYKLNQKIDSQAVALTNATQQITLDTNGKIDSLDNKLTKQIAQSKSVSTHTNTVTYIPKEIDPVTGQTEDTDVELKTQPSKITVKVNDGTKYTFDQQPNEKYKFEAGKLVMTQQTSLDVNVTAKRPSTSRFQILAAMRDKNHLMGGAFYNITPNVAAGVIGGQGLKPYYGLMFKVGGYR